MRSSTAVHNSDYSDCTTPVTSQLSLHTQQRYEPTSFVLKYGEKITGSPAFLHSVTCLYYCHGNRNIIVGIMTGLRCGRSEFRIQVETRIFFLPQNHPDLLFGPPILLFNGYRLSFPGVNWQKSEADRSPPSNAEVKTEWSYYLFPLNTPSWRG